ncbi:hypothetical protein GSI_03371 [Ganoderma sinense ZZ0214-1]|uniref:Uncharacterized protein n=1 Tax=Ganoderma sinense ZZ0214-1 TaxID=1077348 RepID=A0A2G8SLG2_9APHY|nr:hypothetical protein GSI_03371 [Ganoderma sinense ZZ0214-1]
MMATFTSGLRSLKNTFTGTTSRQRRSASVTGSSRTSYTSQCEGGIGVQTNSDDRAAVEPYQQNLQDARKMVEIWKKKAEQAEERAHWAEARLAEANRRRSAEHATFDPRAERPVPEAEHHINHLQATLAQYEQELRRTNDELRDTAALLDRRSAELRDAQAYLNHPDDVADSEVLHLVERINSRIYQTAASIADGFQSRYGEQKDIQGSHEAATRVRRLLDRELFHALNTKDHSGDPMVVQTALQAIMVSLAKWICDKRVRTWQPFGQDAYVDDDPEQQSVAGRWRALSRTYVKMFFENHEDLEGTEVLVLVRDITNILLVYGIATAPQDLCTEVGNSYADALREIVHLSLKFQRITGEGIISRDLRILTARSGKPFDPSRMVDEWADPKKARHNDNTHPVLCTTQLGLVREEVKATEGGVEGRVTEMVLLKPSVVLTSFLEELLSEPSS